MDDYCFCKITWLHLYPLQSAALLENRLKISKINWRSVNCSFQSIFPKHRNASGCREWWTQPVHQWHSLPHLHEKLPQVCDIYHQGSPSFRPCPLFTATDEQEVQKLEVPHHQVRVQFISYNHRILELTFTALIHLGNGALQPSLAPRRTWFLIAICTNIFF